MNSNLDVGPEVQVLVPKYDTDMTPPPNFDDLGFEPEPFQDSSLVNEKQSDNGQENIIGENVQSIYETPMSLNEQIATIEAPSYYFYDGRRYPLICDGVCTHCAHCGIALTDAISIQRGTGPTCSKRGYLEDPVESDEMQAFIDLSEFPELCEYLTKKYKPLGVRSLMNGLVKIASLNRRATGLHSAICDAIDSLGYKRLSSTLRESIAVISISESKLNPDCLSVWVKKSEWKSSWSYDLKRAMGMNHYDRFRMSDSKGILVPKKYKPQLWSMMIKHYEGFSAKTPSGTIKIAPKSNT